MEPTDGSPPVGDFAASPDDTTIMPSTVASIGTTAGIGTTTSSGTCLF